MESKIYIKPWYSVLNYELKILNSVTCGMIFLGQILPRVLLVLRLFQIDPLSF